MTRTILLAITVAIAAPLGAQSLMDRYFDGEKPRKVAAAWEKSLVKWINELHDDARDPISWFPDPDSDPKGKLCRYRIEAANARGLTVRKMLDSGKDANGKPVRVPAKETTVFALRDWQPQYMVTTYPVETSENAADLVGFATWLYEHKADVIANRVLTVLYEKNEGVDPDLQEEICQFIREQEKLKKDPELKTFQLWDADFQVFRKILIPAEQADKFKESRQEAARDRINELDALFKNPERRTTTLAELAFAVEHWPTDFADSAAVKDLASLHSALSKNVADAVNKLDALVKIAEKDEETAKKPKDWTPVAEAWTEALALDPFSMKLLAKAANARFEETAAERVAGPDRWVGDYHVAKTAMDLYGRWREREPANVKVILNIGILHHVRAEFTEAKKCYQAAIELDQDPTVTKWARKYKDIKDWR